MKTIVDTNGKVLQTGDQGLEVVSEEGIPLIGIGEVSDDTVVNVFIHLQEGIKLIPSELGEHHHEILLPRTQVTVVAKNVGTINMNSTFSS